MSLTLDQGCHTMGCHRGRTISQQVTCHEQQWNLLTRSSGFNRNYNNHNFFFPTYSPLTHQRHEPYIQPRDFLGDRARIKGLSIKRLTQRVRTLVDVTKVTMRTSL